MTEAAPIRVAGVDERPVEVGDIVMNVAEAGPADGPPVVLLHGFPDSWRLWRHQVGALSDAVHHVVAPDLRGFGSTDKPTDVGAYGMLGYNYAQRADLSFKCDVDYRGYVRDVDINRR